MTSKIALFCAEASLERGTGHIMRCTVLAEKLQKNGWDCHFVSSKNTYDLIPKVNKYNRVEPQELWLQPFAHDLLVIDNYDLDENYEKHFRKFAKKILAIDDLANRKHQCDILLDQNLGTLEKDYKNLVNEDCKILAGTFYCLLRQEFAELREAALQKRVNTKKISKILVNFGGSDLKNHTLRALQIVEDSDFVGEVEAVLGFNALHFDEVLEFAKKSKNKITVHKQADMAKMIFEADMAIAAGGTSAWERCCLGLPTYIVKIADNQEKIFKELGTKESFNNFYQNLSKNYQQYSANISQYADGKGVDRIISEIC